MRRAPDRTRGWLRSLEGVGSGYSSRNNELWADGCLTIEGGWGTGGVADWLQWRSVVTYRDRPSRWRLPWKSEVITQGLHASGTDDPPRRVADARIHPYAGETAASVCFGLSSTSRTSRFPWCRQHPLRRGTLTATSLMLQLCRLLGVWGEWLVCKIALLVVTRR